MRVIIAIDLDDDVFARWFPSTPLGSIAPSRVNVEWGVRDVIGEVRWSGNVTHHNANGGFQLVRDDLAAEIAGRVVKGIVAGFCPSCGYAQGWPGCPDAFHTVQS